jgi:transcriptional regulator with XRE-family HTH domain
MKNFGLTIVRYRVLKGYTQRGLARKLKISPVHLCRLEHGQTGGSATMLDKICRALDLEIVMIPKRERRRA